MHARPICSSLAQARSSRKLCHFPLCSPSRSKTHSCSQISPSENRSRREDRQPQILSSLQPSKQLQCHLQQEAGTKLQVCDLSSPAQQEGNVRLSARPCSQLPSKTDSSAASQICIGKGLCHPCEAQNRMLKAWKMQVICPVAQQHLGDTKSPSPD